MDLPNLKTLAIKDILAVDIDTDTKEGDNTDSSEEIGNKKSRYYSLDEIAPTLKDASDIYVNSLPILSAVPHLARSNIRKFFIEVTSYLYPELCFKYGLKMQESVLAISVLVAYTHDTNGLVQEFAKKFDLPISYGTPLELVLTRIKRWVAEIIAETYVVVPPYAGENYVEMLKKTLCVS
jgi:hypothetical protein